MQKVLFIPFVLCWGLYGQTSVGGSQSEGDDQLAAILEKLTSLDDRMTSFDDRLNELNGHVDHLLGKASESLACKVFRDLQKTCEEPDVIGTTAGEVVSEVPTTTSRTLPQVSFAPPGSYFRMTKVTREVLEDSFNITLYYEGPEKPVIRQRFKYHDHFVTMEHSQDGVYSTERPKAAPGESAFAFFEFQFPGQSFHLVLYLNEATADEFVVPDIFMTVSPEHDVIYTPGTDVDIKLTVMTKDEYNHLSATNYRNLLAIRSDYEDNNVDIYTLTKDGKRTPEQFNIQYNQSLESGGVSQTVLRIPYNSDKELEGIVQFTVIHSSQCQEYCLLHLYYFTASVRFYPQSHQGPSVQTFLGFRRERNESGQFPNRERIDCVTNIEDRHCAMICMVMGVWPSINITEIRTGRPRENTKVEIYTSEDHAVASIKLANVTLEDAGEFVCEARAEDGTTISKTFSLTVRQAAEIIDEQSRAWKYENGSVGAMCVARGIPPPRITFSIPRQDGTDLLDGLDDADYHVMTTRQLSNTTSGAYFVLYDSEKLDWYTYVPCYASNAPDINSFEFDEKSLNVEGL